MLVSATQLKITRQFKQNVKENTLQYALLHKICPLHKNYLNSYVMMKDADQKDVLHQESCRHGNCSNTGTHENVCQSVIHVLSAVGHVELFHLSTDGGQIWFTQPINEAIHHFLQSSQFFSFLVIKCLLCFPYLRRNILCSTVIITLRGKTKQGINETTILNT